MSLSNPRQELLTEFFLSCRHTGQLFFKNIQAFLQDNNYPEPSQSYWQILKVLKQCGAIAQHAIAKELHHSDAAVSRQISLLLEKKYITATEDPHNRRATIITLTDNGKQVVNEAEELITKHLMEVLAPMSDEDLELLIAKHSILQQLLEQRLQKDVNE